MSEVCLPNKSNPSLNANILSELPLDNQSFLSLWDDHRYWDAVALEILKEHQLERETLTRSKEGSNIVYQVGEDKYLKILDPSSRDSYASERAGLELLAGKLTVPTPRLLSHAMLPSADWSYVLMTKLDGTLVSECYSEFTRDEKLSLMRDLGRAAREVHSVDVVDTSWLPFRWDELMKADLDGLVDRQRKTKLPDHLLSMAREFVEARHEEAISFDRQVILTGEYTPFNLFVRGAPGARRLSGMFDFGDLMMGAPLYDLLGPLTFLSAGDGELQREFLVSYGFLLHELDDQLRETFMTLLLLHRFSNLQGQIKMQDWGSARNFEEMARIVFPLN